DKGKGKLVEDNGKEKVDDHDDGDLDSLDLENRIKKLKEDFGKKTKEVELKAKKVKEAMLVELKVQKAKKAKNAKEAMLAEVVQISSDEDDDADPTASHFHKIQSSHCLYFHKIQSSHCIHF
nr:hypothetical protein [Tanacetum cinerariifolium]